MKRRTSGGGAKTKKQVTRSGKHSIPHCTVVHSRQNFVSVVRYPKKHLSGALKKYATTLPNTTAKIVRFKAGVNGAENVFSILKRNLRRLNLLSRSQNATLNMLSAAWVSKNPGLAGTAKAFALYKTVNMGKTAPENAFKDSDWLTSWEEIS